VEKDAVAYIAFLDAQKEVDRTKKIGTQRYSMGGPLVVKTAAAVRDRIAAGASAQWRDRGARWNPERETGKGRSA
jgi:carboxymethylenebutenolidase